MKNEIKRWQVQRLNLQNQLPVSCASCRAWFRTFASLVLLTKKTTPRPPPQKIAKTKKTTIIIFGLAHRMLRTFVAFRVSPEQVHFDIRVLSFLWASRSANSPDNIFVDFVSVDTSARLIGWLIATKSRRSADQMQNSSKMKLISRTARTRRVREVILLYFAEVYFLHCLWIWMTLNFTLALLRTSPKKARSFKYQKPFICSTGTFSLCRRCTGVTGWRVRKISVSKYQFFKEWLLWQMTTAVIISSPILGFM